MIQNNGSIPWETCTRFTGRGMGPSTMAEKNWLLKIILPLFIPGNKEFYLQNFKLKGKASQWAQKHCAFWCQHTLKSASPWETQCPNTGQGVRPQPLSHFPKCGLPESTILYAWKYTANTKGRTRQQTKGRQKERKSLLGGLTGCACGIPGGCVPGAGRAGWLPKMPCLCKRDLRFSSSSFCIL